MDIEGLEKADILARLYNASKPFEAGYPGYRPGDMTIEEARVLLEAGTRFEYLHGRILKIDLGRNDLRTLEYDRANGVGSAAAALEGVRAVGEKI